MGYWLFKTEPDCYSYDDLEREKKTVWDGVSNNLALKYLRQVKKGDLAVIYHTGDEKAAVGVAEIVTDPYIDPKENDPKLAVVDVKPKKRLKKVVSLAHVKSDSRFQDFLLVKMPRLSVMPLAQAEWDFLTGN